MLFKNISGNNKNNSTINKLQFKFIPATELTKEQSLAIANQIKDWQSYFEKKCEEQGFHIAYSLPAKEWRAISGDLLNHYEDNKPMDTYFIYVDDQLQGIATCNWEQYFQKKGSNEPSPSYHVYDLITAPWNIFSRCTTDDDCKIVYNFDKHDETKKGYFGIGTALLERIVENAERINAPSITAVAGYHWSNVSRFWEKRLFSNKDERSGIYRLTENRYPEFLETFANSAIQEVAIKPYTPQFRCR